MIGSLQALPATRVEITVAGRLMHADPGSLRLGPAFSPAAVRAAGLGRDRIIHFAPRTILPDPGSCLQEPALLASPRGRGRRAGGAAPCV